MENHEHRRRTDDFITLPDLWHICVSHWKWFVVSLGITLGLAVYYLATAPELFTCEAAVLVKQENQGKNAASTAYGDEFSKIGLVQQTTNVSNVQREMTSLKVLAEVVRRVMPHVRENQVIPEAEGLLNRLNARIENDKATIINLTYSDCSLQQAETVLNTIVQVYNELSLQDKNHVTALASRFIGERLELLKKELGDVDDSISAFKVRNKITDVDRVSDIYLQQQSQSEAEILTLTNQQAVARYILGILQDKSARQQLLPTNSGINNAVAEAQITQYNNMLLQWKNNLFDTSPQNPLIIRQESEIEDMRRNILSTIENHIKTIDIQLQALQGYSGEAGSKISSNPDQAKHLASVEREQKVKESLYLYLLQKKEENEINMTYTSYNTQLIDMPHGSPLPTSPNRRNILLAALVMGILVPVVILFVRDTVNNTVRDKYDIERASTLPLIGEVPYCRLNGQTNSWMHRLLWLRKRRSPSPIVVQREKQDLANEAFRLIRTHLEFMTGRAGENNVYIVTSNYPGSGKTFVSVNLTLALAVKGRRVLFIDGDLRHASASRHFGCREEGLADYLGEKTTDLSSLFSTSEEYPTLDILPVGTIPPNPTELLSSERMKQLINDVRHRYEFVIIDCPPVDTLADAGIIGRYADRTLFVIRAGLFIRKHLNDLEDDVNSGKYKHLSVVLNATPLASRYGSRYGNRYDYRYGYYTD